MVFRFQFWLVHHSEFWEPMSQPCYAHWWHADGSVFRHGSAAKQLAPYSLRLRPAGKMFLMARRFAFYCSGSSTSRSFSRELNTFAFCKGSAPRFCSRSVYCFWDGLIVLPVASVPCFRCHRDSPASLIS